MYQYLYQDCFCRCSIHLNFLIKMVTVRVAGGCLLCVFAWTLTIIYQSTPRQIPNSWGMPRLSLIWPLSVSLDQLSSGPWIKQLNITGSNFIIGLMPHCKINILLNIVTWMHWLGDSGLAHVLGPLAKFIVWRLHLNPHYSSFGGYLRDTKPILDY